jgi:DNA-directed RNA polymerase subunit E'/Rpb7
METTQVKQTNKISQYKKKTNKSNTLSGIYSRCLITTKISLPIVLIGKNIVQTFETYIQLNFEERCQIQGFIKGGSSKIISYSCGLVNGSQITYEVVFECLCCFLTEGILVSCKATSITKAGIRAISNEETHSPFMLFVSRDHNFDLPYFANIKEDDVFTARVIGQRFQLNDKVILLIGEIINPQKMGNDKKIKPHLIFDK